MQSHFPLNAKSHVTPNLVKARSMSDQANPLKTVWVDIRDTCPKTSANIRKIFSSEGEGGQGREKVIANNLYHIFT